MTKQVPLRQLLKAPDYRKWFGTKPQLTVVTSTQPWRLFVQREQGGRWAKADLDTYSQAYAGVKSRLSECYDMTIHSKAQAFRPPIVRVNGKKSWMPCPDGHHWCVYCRRPTVFAYYEKHPAMPGMILATYERRCSVCAARQAGMSNYRAKTSWEEFLESAA